MQELIAKLEAATEGSRELDAEIAAVVYPLFAAGAKVAGHPDPGLRQCKRWGRVRASDCTTSIDAALTLVPDDPANHGKPMLWSVAYDEDGVGGERSYTAALGKGYHDPEYIYGHSAATPALALCIAALRARQKEKHDG